MSGITLATEDELSEQVGLMLADEAGLLVDQKLRKGGYGYLRARITNFCQMALQHPVVVIADLDRQQCPSTLLAQWLGTKKRPDNLLVRIAVREIEAWLLADHHAMRDLLGARVGPLPRKPDILRDPKNTLLTLAKRAPRNVRDDLLPASSAVIASQGLGYNARLCGMVKSLWNPARASELSPSLRKARQRLKELAARTEPRAVR